MISSKEARKKNDDPKQAFYIRQHIAWIVLLDTPYTRINFSTKAYTTKQTRKLKKIGEIEKKKM